MESPCVRAAKRDGEATRSALLASSLLRLDLAIREDAADPRFLLLPVEPRAREALPRLDHRMGEFEALPRPPGDYRDIADVPEAVRALLPASFDVVGHVVVMKLSAELAAHETKIAEALLAAVKSARTVCRDAGVEGAWRVRRLRIVAGDPVTETVHTEYGVRLHVDPARVFFSPRLAFERRRVAAAVTPGETVLDLFAGVAPFSIMVARHARPARIIAVDANPDAVKYAERNVRENGVGHLVDVRLADAAGAAAGLEGSVDRVIMNLPHGAAAFVEAAARAMKPGGGILHYYAVLPETEVPIHLASVVAPAAKRAGRSLRVIAQREVHTYSPLEQMWAVDLFVS